MSSARAVRYCEAADATYEFVDLTAEGGHWARCRHSAAAICKELGKPPFAQAGCVATLCLGLLLAGACCSPRGTCWLALAALVVVMRSKVVIGVFSRHGSDASASQARPILLPAAREPVGAPRALIEALPLVFHQEDQHEASCAVCLDDFAQEEQVRQLPCGHQFHSQCIGKWLSRSTRCPLCLHNVAEAPTPCGRSCGSALRRRSRDLQV